MCENCGPPDPEIVKAHEEFEQAVNKYLEAIDQADGIIVDWVFVTAQSIIHENNSSTMVGWSARLNQPAYRTKGLMHEVIDTAGAVDIANHVRDRFQD